MGRGQADVCDEVPEDFNGDMSVAELSSMSVAELSSMGVAEFNNVK